MFRKIFILILSLFIAAGMFFNSTAQSFDNSNESRITMCVLAEKEELY